MAAIDFDRSSSRDADLGRQIVMYTKRAGAVDGLIRLVAALRHHPVLPQKQVGSIDRGRPLRVIVPGERTLEVNSGLAKDRADVPESSEESISGPRVRLKIGC